MRGRSYTPSPPRGYGRRGRSPSPRGRYGGRSRDLHDHPDGGTFGIEIDFFDTVREIKGRIVIYTGIPSSDQTLLFNGEVLYDDGMAVYLGIKAGSHIQLQVDGDAGSHIQLQAACDAQAESRKLRLRIKTPSSPAPLLVEVDSDDTIRRVKEMIQEREASLPVDRLVLQVYNIELLDDLSVYESGLIDDAQIDVFIKPAAMVGSSRGGINPAAPLPGPSRGGAGSSGKLIVKVLPWDWEKTIVVEVNKYNKVEVLRGELERLQPFAGFELPAEYFFIHKQGVMEDDMTFQWHGVKQGDTIDVFRGRVTRDTRRLYRPREQ